MQNFLLMLTQTLGYGEENGGGGTREKEREREKRSTHKYKKNRHESGRKVGKTLLVESEEEGRLLS